LNLLNEKYVFQKRKRILRNPLWTAGSTSKEPRGSLAKRPPEGVRCDSDRWIQSERTGLDREGGAALPTGEEDLRGGCHRRRPSSSSAELVPAIHRTRRLQTGTDRTGEGWGAHLTRRWRPKEPEASVGLSTADSGTLQWPANISEQNRAKKEERKG